jgi:hypothetical protein
VGNLGVGVFPMTKLNAPSISSFAIILGMVETRYLLEMRGQGRTLKKLLEMPLVLCCVSVFGFGQSQNTGTA